MLKERGFYKGVNLGGWLSQCDYSHDRLYGFIKDEDFAVIAGWGLDHVRIPVDYNVIDDGNGGPVEEGFALIDNAIAQCEKNGLNVVLDLHKTAGYSFDAGEKEAGFFCSADLQERYYKLWENIARRYGSKNKNVAFELLNEVTDKEFCESWKNIIKTCIGRIRVYAPDTIIIVGSYWYNSPEALPDLDEPYDKNTVYNFHCYQPMCFTHQGAYWMEEMKAVRTVFEESGTDEALFEKFFAPALEKAAKHGADLYCGEYGVIDIASAEDALKWYKVINRVFEKYGLSRAAWSYREMDFGISDKRMDGVRGELIKYL